MSRRLVLAMTLIFLVVLTGCPNLFDQGSGNGGGDVSVTGVTIEPTSLQIAVGATGSITATVAPENATNPSVSWSSDDDTVATVDGNGVVTGVAAGSATVTVTTEDGGFTAAADVTVTDPGNGQDETVQYAVTTGVTGNGGVSLDPAGGTYDEGTVVTAEAIPGFRWAFENWSGDLTGTDNPQTITVDADKSVSATFVQFSWQGPQIIDAATGNDARVPVVGLDGSGNAVALFQQIVSGTERVYAATRTSDTWGSATIIDANTGGHAVNPKVAVSSAGSAAAVFRQDFDIYGAVYDGTSWSAAVEIDAGSENAEKAVVAIDAAGNAVAAFQQSDGTNDRVYASVYNGTSWSAATAVDAGPGNNATIPSVAMGPEGEAVVLFTQQLSGTGRAYANFYNGSSWEGAEIIDGGADGGNTASDIEFNTNGTAAAIFRKTVSGTSRVYATRYSGTSWGTATAVDPGAGVDTSAPSIALDAGGNAFAVFLRVFDSENGDISAYAATYLAGSWSTAEEISVPLDANNGEVRNVTVAADENGGAAVTFEQMLASNTRVYVTLFDEGAWTGPQIVDAGDTVAADPRIAAGPEGEAVIVFSQWSSYDRVHANVLER